MRPSAVLEGVVALVGSLSVHSGDFMPTMAQNKIPSIGLIPATAADFTSPAAFPIVGGPAVTSRSSPGRSSIRARGRSASCAPTCLRVRRSPRSPKRDPPLRTRDRQRRCRPGGCGGHDALRRRCPPRRHGRPPRCSLRAGRGELHCRSRVGPIPARDRGARGRPDRARRRARKNSGRHPRSTYFFTLSMKNEATKKFVREMKAVGPGKKRISPVDMPRTRMPPCSRSRQPPASFPRSRQQPSSTSCRAFRG